MKVEVSGMETIDDFTGFVGLAEDREGDIWLCLKEWAFMIFDDSSFESHDKVDVLRKYGPFTVFTGSLTISN